MNDNPLIAGNEICFDDTNGPFWGQMALGFQPYWLIEKLGVESSVYLVNDTDGIPIRDGGLQAPQETKVRKGQAMFRFVGSKKTGDKFQGTLFGNWWVDYETFVTIEGWAKEHGISLSEAAMQLLALPPKWTDSAWLFKVRVTQTLRAYVGKGGPATGEISPAQAKAERKKVEASLYAPPEHLEIKQYFIPGSPAILQSSMEIENLNALMA